MGVYTCFDIHYHHRYVDGAARRNVGGCGRLRRIDDHARSGEEEMKKIAKIVEEMKTLREQIEKMVEEAEKYRSQINEISKKYNIKQQE